MGIQSAPNALFKRQAYRAFKNAMRWHLIPVPAACEICGKRGKLVGHHPDYSNGVAVKFLCRSCHAKVHWGTAN